MHGSSYLSNLPDEILLVTHLRKQMSVREWIAVREKKNQCPFSDGNVDGERGLCGESENFRELGHIQPWILAFCDSLTTNCCSSCLSRSESLVRSRLLEERESIFFAFAESGGRRG